MTWYLWLIAAYSALGLIAPVMLFGQYVPQSFTAFVGSLVIRPLILWGLGNGGTPMWLVIVLALAFFLELLVAAGQIDKSVYISGATVVWNVTMWGGVAAAVALAAQS